MNGTPYARVILRIESLSVAAARKSEGDADLVKDVSFEIKHGEILGLVGESGSGKSLTALAIAGLLPPTTKQVGGQVELDGMALDSLDEESRRAHGGQHIGIVFQDPFSSLNPVRKIGSVLVESIRRNLSLGRTAARERAVAALQRAGISDASRCMNAYPHELSGGLRQRCMIALATANAPILLVADEPTTALDTTVQLQILRLMSSFRTSGSVLLITHDLGVASEICSHVAVMYHGRIVERGSTAAVLDRPSHPYTRALLALVPTFDTSHRLVPIPGAPPTASRVFAGCAFSERCAFAMDRCRQEAPPWRSLGPDGAGFRCWLEAGPT